MLISTGQKALITVIQTLFQLYIIVVLLRFLLQLAKADFYNPVSQAIVKLTSPLLLPLRRVIPSVRGLDMASLVLALLLALLMTMAIELIITGKLVFSFAWIIQAGAYVLYYITQIYFFAIIIAALSSWLPALHNHPITRLIWQLVEPVQAPFRKILPDLGGIDLSPIFALLAIQVVQMFLAHLL